MVPSWETHPDSDTQPRLLSAVSSSILFRDSPSLPREKVIAAEKAERSVEAAITLWRSHTHKLEKWSSTSKWRLDYWRILFLGIPRKSGTCANSGYQALFFPPREKGLGTRLGRPSYSRNALRNFNWSHDFLTLSYPPLRRTDDVCSLPHSCLSCPRFKINLRNWNS